MGLALGWSSAAAAVLDGAQGMPVTLEEWSWVTSLFCVGASIGAGSVGKLVHSLGRRTVILAVGPVTLVAWALHMWASSVRVSRRQHRGHSARIVWPCGSSLLVARPSRSASGLGPSAPGTGGARSLATTTT